MQHIAYDVEPNNIFQEEDGTWLIELLVSGHQTSTTRRHHFPASRERQALPIGLYDLARRAKETCVPLRVYRDESAFGCPISRAYPRDY